MAISTSGIAQQSLQDAILDAIDYLTEEKMSKLTLDKTIVAIVVKRKDVLQNTYYIKYQDNSNLVATAQGDTVYKAGQQVYVLVPQNDLSKDKIILGTASSDNANTDSSFISSALDDYTYTGESAFVKNTTSLGLDSYKTVDSGTLYVSDEFKEENQDVVGEDDWWSQHLEGGYVYNSSFKTSAANSEKLMLRAEFRTDLPAKHRVPGCGGEYGVKALLSFNTNIVDHYLDEEGNVCDALPEGGTTVYKKRHQLYTLESTSSSFVGQPLNYPTFTEQSAIFDFDAENFEGIDSVVVYSHGFPQIENAPVDTYDIFVRNVQIYTLARITSMQGDYSLRINPSNLVFLEKGEGDSLSTKAEFRKKSLNLSSDSRMKFWWGAEDKSVTSTSSGYQGYLGSGWKYLPGAGNSSSFSTSRNENRAYENRYKCAAAYSGDNDASVILSQEFTVYNQAAQKDIQISSDLGTEFAFDNGSPTLTCSVDKATSWSDGTPYRFVWSISEDNGESRKIYSEKEASETLASIRRCLKDKSANISVTDLTTAQTNLSLAAGVEYGSDEKGSELRNVLTLPVSSIASSATVYCTVYDKDGYCVGTASIALRNSKSVEVAKYHIVISNGSQSFQYSEMGVSPCDSDYYGQDYQAILPLSCRFYDPTGLEIPSNQYVVQWAVPTEDTFFVTSDLNLQEKNSAGDTQEWVSDSQVLEFKIQDKWRYAYTNRQITAIVTYHGEEFRKDTEFLFAKIGDSGTNGTDYVVKIVPSHPSFFPLPTKGGNLNYYEQSCLPAVYVYNNGETDKLLGSRPTLGAQLYQGGTEAATSSFTWSIAKSGTCNQVSPLEVSSEGELSLLTKTLKGTYYRGQVVKVKAKVNETETSWDTVYGFYPLPVVKTHIRNEKGYFVSLSKKYTMQQVLYNSDGKFPQYDTDQGFKIDGIFEYNASNGEITSVSEENFTVTPTLYGGVNENKDGSTSDLASCKKVEDKDPSSLFDRYVITPKETYNGLYQNNGVHLEIKEKETVVCEVWVPIYLSLNRYSLASLNAWDGNSIEIKSDGGDSYILAPQIGAGVKNDDNSFTGIVMGSRVTQVEETDENNKPVVKDQNDVGLFGYCKGQQSIFLDAQTGKATFGLPESDTDNYRGRIVLDPTGEGRSTIANLTLASSTLFGSIKAGASWDTFQNEAGEPYDKEKDRFNNLYWPTKAEYVFRTTAEKSNDMAIRKVTYNAANASKFFSSAETLVEDSKDEYKTKGRGPYTDFPVFGAKMGIPYDQHGILISADPPYISVKGHPLNPANSDIKWENANTLLVEGDALEVELDPNKAGGLFTIYRHHREKDEDGEENSYTYKRTPLVGIDELGNFYTNAVKQEKTSMTINKVGAFGETAGQSNGYGYMGASFSYDDNSILKIFQSTTTPTEGSEDTNTYLTAGTSIKDEYPRGIRVNAKDFGVYVGSGGTSKTTGHYLLLKEQDLQLKTGNSLLEIKTSKNTTPSADDVLRLTNDVTIDEENYSDGFYFKRKDATHNLLKIVADARDDDKASLVFDGGDDKTRPKMILKGWGKDLTFKENGLSLGLSNENIWLDMSSLLDSDNSKYPKIELHVESDANYLQLSRKRFYVRVGSAKGKNNDRQLWISDTGGNTGIKQMDGTDKDEPEYCKLNFNDSHDALLRGYNKLTLQGGSSGVTINTTEDSNYVTMNGSVFLLHSTEGISFDLYKEITDSSDKSVVLVGSSLNGNILLNGEKKGIYFTEPGKNNTGAGLVIKKYTYNDKTYDIYGLARGTDASHALEVEGHTLMSGDARITGSLTTGSLTTGSLTTGSLTVGGKTGMNEGWFKEIQKLYNSGTENGDTKKEHTDFNGTTLKAALASLKATTDTLQGSISALQKKTIPTTVYSSYSGKLLEANDKDNISTLGGKYNNLLYYVQALAIK